MIQDTTTQRLEDMSNAELRIALADAEYTRGKTQVGIFRRQDRMDEITNELLRRGAF